MSYTSLLEIETVDCNEQLVALGAEVHGVNAVPINQDMAEYTGADILVRESVSLKLIRASERLRRVVPDSKLRIVYGYRHPSVQRRYFNTMYSQIAKQCPQLKYHELMEETHKLIAVPEVAGHPSGGAVDLTIIVGGLELDMGTKLWSFETPQLLPVFSESITILQQRNRLLLRSIMMEQEFAPFDGEWWHFSYGDREWAEFFRKPHAIYSTISL